MINPLAGASREVKITLVLWTTLIAAAIAALVLLNANTSRILNHIYFVNVSRAAKAAVLYAAAEDEARKILRDFEKRNSGSAKIIVPPDDPHVRQSVELYHKAGDLDLRPEFDTGRAESYELLAQVYDAAGLRREQLLTGARAFMARKDFQDASSYIVQAEDATSQTIDSKVLHAQLLQLQGQTSAALTLLNVFESSHSLSAKGLAVKAGLYLQDGNAAEAVSYYQKAVKAQPKNLNFRKALADAEASVGRMNEATTTLQEGLDDGGWMDPAYLHVYGDYLVAKGDLDEAIRVLKQSDKLAPQSGDVQWSLARAYHKAGKSREAASTLRRATEIRPELHDQIF